ncbi:2-isopropylmalate synthase [Roseomonas sp. NAR14]|uniref:2-isopropylmalate synthase n=1 Tax=Roseomonas acroporae TaxID=2937791 RepID=A0A9X1YHY5_9PROT|nr:2-isopropylmalate synthase [Roseomonas acroporae]MCK8786496.1 2-isopropylmalate synthase [Roseomonas acroporae]
MAIEHPSFGKLEDDRIIFFDTTLRDGEQSPGFSMNLEEKLRMAEALADLGVDVIEAGFAIASPGDFDSVKSIAQRFSKDGPVVASLSRAHQADIMRSVEATKPAARPRVHIVLATSDLHMRVKLRMSREEVLESIASSVGLARNHAADVEWSAEDGSRSDIDFLCRCVETAIRAGATTINIPDTVGYSMPEDIAAIFRALRERVPGAEKVIFSAHNHNDLGMAVANTLAAVRAGVRQIESTINGIGERAGNASLEEVAMALRTRRDVLPFRSNIVTTSLLRTSKLLATITGFDVQPNKAIVGRNAFAHESGIHQDGVLKDASTYEIMTPESVGWTTNSLVLGKHSGRAAFRDKLRALGYPEIGDNQLNDAFRRFKDIADRKKVVYDEDVAALVDDEVLRAHDRVKLVGLTVATGLNTRPMATLKLEIDGEEREGMAVGDGAVDATFNAIRQVFPHEVALKLYAVQSITGGTDAQARVTVRFEEHGKLVDGQGSDTDTIVASARAYVHALNKLLVKRERTAPAEIVPSRQPAA